MILLVDEQCVFCKKVMEEFGSMFTNIFRVIRHPDNSSYIQLDDKNFIPLPYEVKELPAMIHRNHIYIGANPIEQFCRGIKEGAQRC